MPYLQLQDRQFPLPAGEATIGAFEGAVVRLPSGDPNMRAVVSVSAGGVVIRRGTPDSVVSINGVQLGAEPSPLLHGDRVELAGHELRLGEDQKAGSTQFVSASDIAAVLQGKGATPPRKPTMAVGGRVISLVDGREYAVPDEGLTFGREVGHGVVIASTEISRRHASIVPGTDGYMLRDHSTNGVWVNGERMADELLLGRGDIIKMGAEEFRFYADVAPSASPAAGTAPAVVAPAPVIAAAAPAPAAAAAIAEPATAPSAATGAQAPQRRPALATLEVITTGPLKGTRFELHSALTNIGRGAHNDIAIRDESVSDSHAKIQRRGDGWWIVDQDSTNGTYVGGRRVQGEQRLEGAPDLRFGGIKMTFRTAADAVDEMGGTRAIAAMNPEAARRTAASRTPALAKTPLVMQEEPRKGCASMIAFLLTLAGSGAGLLSFLFLAGR